MKTVLVAILMVVMLAFAGSAMACGGFHEASCPAISSINLSGGAQQDSAGVLNTSKGNDVNGAGASVGFSQSSTGSYTANFSGTGDLSANGSAKADGFAQITSDLDKINNGYRAEVDGTLNNSASAIVSGKNCAGMNAQATGTGSLNTSTGAGIGMGTSNGVIGQTSTAGTFNYLIDPTKSVSGQGSLSGTGMSQVQSIPGDNAGFKVTTSATSNAAASVNLR